MNAARFTLVVRAALALAFTAGGMLLLAPAPDAEAGPVTRPIRDTSSRTTSTSGKVLVAIPKDGGYSYLHRATRSYFGRPVKCGLDHDASLDDAKLVLMRLPANRRYAAGYSLCDANRSGRSGLATVYGSDRSRGDQTSANINVNIATDGPTASMSGGFMVIAAGATKRTDLPEAMQNDGWALLDANRFRDAADAFAEMPERSAADEAGHAIAMAMTGQLDAAANKLAALMSGAGSAETLRRAAAEAQVTPKLKAQLATLADTLFVDRPAAAAALATLSGGQDAEAA